MQHAPEKQNGEDGLPIPPYKVYNIGNNSPENLLDFITILQEELIAAKVLPLDYDFEAHKELVPMQPGDVQLLLQIQHPWNRTSDFVLQRHLEMDWDHSLSGMQNIMV